MSRQQRINDLLSAEMNPSVLEIEDESHRHHVPQGAETHFKVLVVSAQFTHLSRLARHRLVNALLAAEFDRGLHALSLHLHTPEEWIIRDGTPPSPACRDGYQRG